MFTPVESEQSYRNFDTTLLSGEPFTIHFKSCITISAGPSDVLDVEHMSESDVTDGKQLFFFIIFMVIII